MKIISQKYISLKSRSICVILLVGMFSIIACSKSDAPNSPVEPPSPPTQPDNRTLKEAASFEIGAAVSVSHLKEADFEKAFRDNFSQLTAESEMKMKQIWKGEGQYNFDNSDYLVNYGQQNGIGIHGHTLLWYRSFPDWFISAGYDSTQFENHVKEYIQTVVGRYKGKIESWDVANEIFADNGSLRVDDAVYKTFEDPIAFYGRCFQYARDADPDVKLFYNDYDMVLNTSKRNAVKAMVARFRKEGFPIDGLGEQMHTTSWTNLNTIKNGLADLGTVGLLIHISELDVRMNQDKSDSYIFTDAEAQKQSDVYKAIVAMFELLPDSEKFAITTWGVTDKYSWLTDWWHPKVYPLLFDKDYGKKKAYAGFLSALK